MKQAHQGFSSDLLKLIKKQIQVIQPGGRMAETIALIPQNDKLTPDLATLIGKRPVQKEILEETLDGIRLNVDIIVVPTDSNR
jgi:hypothetical protein